MRGVLITFEGVEGSGKSTQARRLADFLEKQGIKCLLSREPGGTDIGERLREILLDTECQQMAGLTEMFLYMASRAQHVRERILPALRSGSIVVLDRFADSSLAYQGQGRGLGEGLVARFNKVATGGLKPHLTVLVDVAVTVGQGRKSGGELDRLERERVEFHERIRTGYLRIARRAPGRVKVIDGTRSAGELEIEVRRLVTGLLNRKGLLRG